MYKKNWQICLEQVCADTRKVVESGAEKVGEAAETVMDAAKAKLALLELNSALRTQLMKVGELVYATHTGDPTDSETLEEVLHRIDILKAEIREKEWELSSIRGSVVCSGCGCSNSLEHAFCSNCGKAL